VHVVCDPQMKRKHLPHQYEEALRTLMAEE
jgi:hypothetical protein